jgi:hypothetical protein
MINVGNIVCGEIYKLIGMLFFFLQGLLCEGNGCCEGTDVTK